MTKKFNPLRSRYRATFSGTEGGKARLGKIDMKREVLHGVQITLEGEAKGHGIHLDREFCEAVAAAGNATGSVGVKVRYGHPAMCSDALGTELGRAKKFAVRDIERTAEDGTTVTVAGVFADVHILKSAHSAPQGDIAKHVLEMAAEDPTQFGQSIVFTYADWIVKDADGKRHSYNEEVLGLAVEKPEEDEEEKPEEEVKPEGEEEETPADPEAPAEGDEETPADDDEEKPEGEEDDEEEEEEEPEQASRLSEEDWMGQSADGKVYAVLGKLHGTDFTDTPAATDGVFSTGTLAEEAEQMLDEHPQIFDAIEKSPKSVVEFLERTGLMGKIETARIAGLQAAKDREIAALKAEIAAFAVQIKDLSADIDAKSLAFDEAQAIVKQLEAERDNTAKALSETKAALAAETERYRALVGCALTPPAKEPASSLTAWSTAMKARNASRRKQ